MAKSKLKNVNITAIKILFFRGCRYLCHIDNKYFIGYMYDDYKYKPLCIIISKMSAYIKNYDGETKWMCSLIEDDELLETYNDSCQQWY